MNETKQETVPLLKCRTFQGTFVGFLGAILPLVSVEILKFEPNVIFRVLASVIGLAGSAIVIISRYSNNSPPISGIIGGGKATD